MVPRAARVVSQGGVGGALAVALALGGLSSTSARGDIVPQGEVSIHRDVKFEWGPLDGRLARAVDARAGDTWDTFAAREMTVAGWAPTIRALNGGDAAPSPVHKAWAPPRELAVGSPFFVVYLDSAKFGPDSDVSRTGFDPIDPSAPRHAVFGESTLALLRVSGLETPVGWLESAKAAFELPKRSAAATIRNRPNGLVLVNLGREPDSVSASSPLRRTVTTWRCNAITNGKPIFESAAVVRYGAGDRPLTDAESTEPRGPGTVLLMVTAIAAAAAALLVFLNRRRVSSPPPA